MFLTANKFLKGVLYTQKLFITASTSFNTQLLRMFSYIWLCIISYNLYYICVYTGELCADPTAPPPATTTAAATATPASASSRFNH